MSKVRKALDVELYERCRVCKGLGQFKDKTCLMCEGQGFAAIGMKLLELERLKFEVNRLRAELAEAKAEPPRPAALLWTDGTAWHAYEQWEDADRDRCQAAKEPPLMVVKEWTWHPKSP